MEGSEASIYHIWCTLDVFGDFGSESSKTPGNGSAIPGPRGGPHVENGDFAWRQKDSGIFFRDLPVHFFPLRHGSRGCSQTSDENRLPPQKVLFVTVANYKF